VYGDNTTQLLFTILSHIDQNSLNPTGLVWDDGLDHMFYNYIDLQKTPEWKTNTSKNFKLALSKAMTIAGLPMKTKLKNYDVYWEIPNNEEILYSAMDSLALFHLVYTPQHQYNIVSMRVGTLLYTA